MTKKYYWVVSARFTARYDTYREALVAWASHDVLASLGQVQCPMLVVRGEDDFWVPRELADETARALPKGEVLHLPDVGHYPMFEAPALVARFTGDFCRKHGILRA